MALLTKEVEITLSSSTIKYYENLGYKIPRVKDKYNRLTVPRGTKIKVLVKDLYIHSNVYVYVECDCCGKQYQMQYDVYNAHNHDGKIYCVNCAARMLISGKNHYNWNSNLTDAERNNGRHIEGYVDFIKKVLERDSYICQCCGKSYSNKMEVHHLNGYNWFIDGRVDETNAVTLCEHCHKNFHLLYGWGDNTKEQYEEWIGHAVVELRKYNGVLPIAKRIFCVEDNMLYDNANMISQIFNISRSKIYEVCNHKASHTHGYHFLWEDEYLQLSEKQLNNLRNDKKTSVKKVICITTGKIFNSLAEAARCYNIKVLTHISRCCRNMPKHVHAGKLLDGTPLKWMYYEDFLKFPIERQNEILSRNVEPSNDGSF